jgi:hypothetical protein
MGKDAKKAEKSAKYNKKKLKKLLDTGNEDGARIYAQNAIRMENQAQNLHRISSRVEAVACRLDSALKMNAVRYNAPPNCERRRWNGNPVLACALHSFEVRWHGAKTHPLLFTAASRRRSPARWPPSRTPWAWRRSRWT